MIDFSIIRSSFGLARKKVNVPESVNFEAFSGQKIPVVIEGSELLDAICPVNKLTGKRCNPLSLLGLLTGSKSDVLNAILQELPTISSNPNLTDEDRVNYIVERCSSGTPAEDALMAQRLMNDIEALGLSSKQADKVADSSISFAPDDAPDSKGE